MTDDPGQNAGGFYDRNRASPSKSIFSGQGNNEIQALVRYLGERMGRIQNDWSQKRTYLVFEIGFDPGSLRLISVVMT